jgi:hypothetical protein
MTYWLKIILRAGPISNLVTKPTAPLPRPGIYPGGGFPHLLSPYEVILSIYLN